MKLVRHFLTLTVFALGLIQFNPTASAAQPRPSAERRVALVIGNSAYASSPLTNPANDARDMAAALRKLGFDVVEKLDATQKDMNRAIGQFGEKLREDSIALFFYAGHGMQVKGKNYLIPVDAQIKSEATVPTETVDVDAVMAQLAVSRLNIVILDACRNNPFERGFRSVGGGLAQMDAPKGSLIAYATAPGKTAADGTGKNGLYTQELLKNLQTPGMSLESVFKQVRIGVMKASGENQMPWESSSLTGDFFFRNDQAMPRPPAGAETHPPAASNPAADAMAVELSFWETIKNSLDAEDFQEYLRQYPQGKFVGLANNRLKKLRQDAPTQDARNSVAGDLYSKAKNGDAAAVVELRRIAVQGDVAAQMNIGRLYSSGWGVEKNDEEAVKWFRKAADQGSDRAQGILATLYLNGRGVPKDEGQAAMWYRKSAERGNAAAQNSLGVMYETGRGLIKDEAEASRWYRKAADQSLDAAEFNLGRLYRAGRGVEKNDDEARKWLRRAADKGHKLAQDSLLAMANTPPVRTTATATPVAANSEPSPKAFCADRPNIISRGICERRECEKPYNAKDPYCEQYLNKENVSF